MKRGDRSPRRIPGPIQTLAERLAARHSSSGIVIAVASTVAAVALRLVLDPWLGDRTPHSTAYIAVVVTVWLGGWRAGMLSAVLGFLACDWFFLAPRGSFGGGDAAYALVTLSYLVACALLIAMGYARDVALRRLRAEQARSKRSEEFHHAIAELAADFAWTGRVEPDGTVVTEEVTEGFRRHLGYDVKELAAVGGWNELVHPDDRALAARAMDRALRGETISGELRQVTRDGREIRVSYVTRPVMDASGRVVRLYGGSRDITEQHRASEALRWALEEARVSRQRLEAAVSGLRQSEGRLAAILQAMPAPVYLLDTEGRYLHVNRRYEEIVGKRADELLGRPMTDVFSEELTREFMRNNQHVLEAGHALEFEEYSDDAQGRHAWSSVKAPLFDATGRIAGIAGVSLDITDRKRTEAALSRSEARLRLLWEAAEVLLTAEDPDAMLRTLFERIGGHIGADAYLNYVPDESGTMLRLASGVGLEPQQFESIRALDLGQAVCGTVARDRVPCVATSIQQSDDPKVQLVKSFGFRSYACNPLLVGDELLGTLSFASRTRDAFGDDELEFLRIVSRYVTAAFERLRLIARLRETDTRKDQFLATLAHELRNPLAPIRNMLEVLSHDDGDPALRRHARETMVRQVDQMVRLVDDLLDVSRITRNRLELRRERTELAAAVRAALETCRPLLDAQRHVLTVDLPPEPVFLDADPVRLAQVFGNLLNNACKYTAPGGNVALRAERQGSDVVVEVRDDGIGIPAAMLPRIFDVFTQVDRSIERSQGGLGIGLTLVRQLVEMHGGRVEARSEGEGKGSSFRVHLPALVEQPAAPAPVVPGAALPSSPPRRILVVDDYRDSAESLAIFLRFVGHETFLAHDGEEALQAAERHRPDVILLDIGLPKLNGLDVCRRLREHPWGREMTIFALTGWGQDEDRRRSQEAGFDSHLVKPVNYRALAETLATLPVAEGAR